MTHRCGHRRHRWPHLACGNFTSSRMCWRHLDCNHPQYDQLERTWTWKKQRDWAVKM